MPEHRQLSMTQIKPSSTTSIMPATISIQSPQLQQQHQQPHQHQQAQQQQPQHQPQQQLQQQQQQLPQQQQQLPQQHYLSSSLLPSTAAVSIASCSPGSITIMSRSSSNPVPPVAGTVRPKQQLIYLAEVLGG